MQDYQKRYTLHVFGIEYFRSKIAVSLDQPLYS